MKGLKTGGRQKGTPNKRTEDSIVEAAKSGLLPLDYMLEVMRDSEADTHRRDEMAKSAAPYLHAKVSSDGMHMNVRAMNGGGTHPNAEISGIRVEFVKPSHVADD